MSHTVTSRLAAMLLALCMANLVVAYALFLMSPGEAAGSPSMWLLAIIVAGVTYLTTHQPKTLRTEQRN